MKKIKLTQGKHTIIDDIDFIKLSNKKWYFSHGYAMRDSSNGRIYMHRLINNTKIGLDTDHINRNTLDNRRKNLRSVTRSQNQINRATQKNNTSGYKGITWNKKRKKWQAQILINNKYINLGCFIKIKDAIIIRKNAELIYHSI